MCRTSLPTYRFIRDSFQSSSSCQNPIVKRLNKLSLNMQGPRIININFNKKIGWETDKENDLFLGFTRTTIEKNINTRLTSYSRSLQ